MHPRCKRGRAPRRTPARTRFEYQDPAGLSPFAALLLPLLPNDHGLGMLARTYEPGDVIPRCEPSNVDHACGTLRAIGAQHLPARKVKNPKLQYRERGVEPYL